MTIYDIARKAGVSIATVSRVLNGGNVKEETRNKVQQVLDTCDYHPSQVAQGLANRQTRRVAVMTLDIRDVHHAAIAYEIERAMADAGYSTVLCNLGSDTTCVENALRGLRGQQFDGVFFIGSVFAMPVYSRCITRYITDIPILLTNAVLPQSNVYGVLADEAGAFCKAAKKLYHAGRRDIAFVMDGETRSERSKLDGYARAMAQCGFLIPADERSEICVFDEFLVDIGDEQSIEQSLSTFSGHMKKITGILELAMPHTLVLLDELGAGTDPAEGAALAVAIIEELRRRGVLLMATTHYAELKVFALETKGVVNASCEFDLETLRPTYKLSVGVPGKSNAFLISEKLGIPERVIEAAQQHLSAEDKRLDAVLGQLDDLKLQLKESQNEVEELKNEASHQLEAAQKKRDELIRQGENELEAARAKARALAQQVESQAYALTDELRQLQKDERMSTQQKAQRAREIAKKESEKLFIGSEAVHNPVKEFVPLKEVKVGQEVCIAELNQLATVLALPDKNGDVLVRAGIIKTKVPLKGLKQPEKLVKEKKPQTKAQQRYSRLTGDANRPNGRVERVQRSAKMECNLLGLTVDEALPEVDSFIDRAILNGQTVVYLIHGNGTGALRTAIHKHLRGNRMVKSFRLGRYGEGESGVTVVELK